MDDIATVIRRERQAALLTQRELAQKAGLSRSQVARYESGTCRPSIAGFERILAVVGLQPTWEVEPLDDDVRRRIAKLAASPIQDRRAYSVWTSMSWLVHTAHRVEGLAAANLLGAPVPVEVVDVGVAAVDATFVALGTFMADGSHLIRSPEDDLYRSWLPASRAPVGTTSAGQDLAAALGRSAREWVELECPDSIFWSRGWAGDARVRLVAPSEVERRVDVVVEGSVIPVQPLDEVETNDPDVARVLRVMRER